MAVISETDISTEELDSIFGSSENSTLHEPTEIFGSSENSALGTQEDPSDTLDFSFDSSPEPEFEPQPQAKASFSAQDERELLNAVSSGSLDDSDFLLDDPDLSELEPGENKAQNSCWSNNPWMRTGIIAGLAGGVFGVIWTFLALFSAQRTPILNATGTDLERSTDPTAQAIQEAENSKAKLILLGDTIRETPPITPTEPDKGNEANKSVESTATAPSPQPVRTPTPSAQPVRTPTPTRRTSRPVPPSRPSQRVATPPPPHSTVASVSTAEPEPEPEIDRQALSQRGWSGFVEAAVALKADESVSDEQIAASSTSPTSSDDIPVIRLGDENHSVPPIPNWSYQAKTQGSLMTFAPNTTLVASNTSALRYLNTSKERLSKGESVQFPLGTQLQGKLTSPIIYTTQAQFRQPFTVELTEDLSTNKGRVALPAGTLMVGKVIDLTPSGMVSAEITAISYTQGRRTVHQAIPSGQILLLGENSQPLRAQRLNDPSGAIAGQDLLLGTLGAASTGLEYANQPDTQTIIQQSGQGFSSSSTTTNQDVDLAAGLAEGFFQSLEDRVSQRAETAIQEYQSQTPEYQVQTNTQVQLFFNAVLEINL
ncbi:MAG: hypothetical protein AB4058_06475 [Microcystaceae cyanobacterium]